MYFTGGYFETDTEFINGTIEEVSKLDNLKSLKVYTAWYEAFSNAGLGCEIEEENFNPSWR